MWSRTIVPTVAMDLLSSEAECHAEEPRGEKQGFFRRYQQGFERNFEKFREGYRHALSAALESSTLFAACFLGFCVLSAGLVFLFCRDLFPPLDAPPLPLHLPPPPRLRHAKNPPPAAPNPVANPPN